jgi:hypothetical protein
VWRSVTPLGCETCPNAANKKNSQLGRVSIFRISAG